MKQISGKEFIRIIQKHGWILKRINGSHHIFIKEGHPERIVIPVHGNRPLKIGLLKHQISNEDCRTNRIRFVIGLCPKSFPFAVSALKLN